MAEGPLSILADVDLVKIGSGFVMAGLDIDTARWATVSEDGTLKDGSLRAFPVPAHVAGPWFGVAGGAATPQLIAVYVAPNPSDATRTQVLAVGQGAGDTATAPVKLFETEAGTKAEQIRVAVGSSSSGDRVGVAIGFADQPSAPISMVLVGKDGQAIGPADDLTEVGKDWRCLQFFSSTRSPIGLSQYDPTFTQDTKPVARIYEFRDDASVAFIGKPQLTITPDASCPLVAPSGPQSYLIGWNTPEGASVADYSIEHKTVMSEFLGGTITFKGPVPKMVALAPVEGSFAVAFAGTTGDNGPQVRLYDFQGTRQGAPLFLPLRQGNVGRVTGLSSDKTLFVTYREGANLSVGSGPRRFVRVACER